MSNLNDNVGFWDSVLIENLTEETFISNIYQRYKRGLIYVSTWQLAIFGRHDWSWFEFLIIIFYSIFDCRWSQTYIGAFLVAVNPYKPLANYSTDAIRTYAKSNYFKLPPHM